MNVNVKPCPNCRFCALVEKIYRGGKTHSCGVCGYLMCWKTA